MHFFHLVHQDAHSNQARISHVQYCPTWHCWSNVAQMTKTWNTRRRSNPAADSDSVDKIPWKRGVTLSCASNNNFVDGGHVWHIRGHLTQSYRSTLCQTSIDSDQGSWFWQLFTLRVTFHYLPKLRFWQVCWCVCLSVCGFVCLFVCGKRDNSKNNWRIIFKFGQNTGLKLPLKPILFLKCSSKTHATSSHNVTCLW